MPRKKKTPPLKKTLLPPEQNGNTPENTEEMNPAAAKTPVEYYVPETASIPNPESGGNGTALVPDSSEDEMFENAVNADAAQCAASYNTRLKTMMDQNFIEFASYVIKDRAIPDIDDGLKPVQRRILWAMFQHEDGSFHKVAGVIGDTMKFHPHGDASIGDALVYLANRELYIEKQGNFGSVITGKPAAAPRYIECRLSALAKEVLFNRDITVVADSYDGRDVEPLVLPSKIPTLLIMGTEGIAVGTNTRIMPHNFCEVLEAQIAYLQGKPFALYPDFMQGGVMDVSKYDDGLGKITVRAKLETQGRIIVIREIPATTDTEKLMDSIESAVNKNKIKIASFHDYTAADVDIHLTPIRGYNPEKTLNALYAYTNCQLSISCNPMVIRDNKPVQVSISAILKHNTDRLVQYLTWELQIESGKCLDKILARTLTQIFIEERVYKRIEKCRSKDAMFHEVRTGLEKFRSEWLPVVQRLYETLAERPDITPLPEPDRIRLEQLARGVIPDSEIERLVEIPIRRISAFEIDENREQIELQNKALSAAEKNLKHIKQYTIKYLRGLLEHYGSLFPRRTEIRMDGFQKINMREVALNNIRVGWDRKNAYIGTNVKSDDTLLCNEVDHLLCVERDGSYKVINIPDKIYVDRLFEFRKYDKDTIFGIVYSEKKTGRVYMKRTRIDKFITDKEYRIIPPGCRLEVITSRPNAIYEIRIDTPIHGRQIQEINLMEAPLRSPKAGGKPVSQRKLLKINFLRYLDESDETVDAGLFPLQSANAVPEIPPVIAPVKRTRKPAEESTGDAGKPSSMRPRRETASTLTVPGKGTVRGRTEILPSVPEKKKRSLKDRSKPPEPPEEEEETWGIQPDLGF